MTTPPITVYTTPTCPWCTKAKDYLRSKGAPFREVDVASDQQAAQEMVARSHQMGVPVIADEREFIVGFDIRRLEQMAARHTRRGLGLQVKDAPDGSGALVGVVREGSPSAEAGVQPGDVIQELGGLPVGSAAELEKAAGYLMAGARSGLRVLRDGQTITLSLMR
jgi:glutaredoxin-like YruB-family protein